MLERVDKLIVSQGQYSRSEVKALVSRCRVLVDGVAIRSSSEKVDPDTARIVVNGAELVFKRNVYLMLHKPQGYVSATEDKSQATVLELVPEEYRGRELFPAGRLDKDTTGLMIITDDGAMAHRILSPKKHVQKVYLVEIDVPMSPEMVSGFAAGVELNDGVCQEAKLEITGSHTGIVTLREGRYHQIKRMFGCFGGKVVRLHRLAMGNLFLPEDLPEGECRELNEEELKLLQQIQ